ncbi:MAG: nickel pincer cofactor biosynthesis protein LarC [Acidobacteria bacterium]|nr:nickel pincer cofactor biosynthesis protein LarC [Acidobacteriota bacterium]
MKVLYFDCFAGAAGDMLLGALIDAGLPVDELHRALGTLGVDGWAISADRVLRAGVSATKFRVHESPPVPAGEIHDRHEHRHAPAHDDRHQHAGAHSHRGASEDPGYHEGHGHHQPHPHSAHRSLAEIRTVIDRSALSDAGKLRAVALFTRLGEAEAAIHGMAVERVHLHEVGAIDSIIDIVGTVFALEWFGADRIVVSPINVGGGMVRSAHGLFPVPAPATLRLLGDAPVYSSGLDAELLTPTGALLLSDYASAYGPLPAMRVERAGYGAGDRDFAETPNVLRVIVGTSDATAPVSRVVVIECTIDDMNPQLFGSLMDRLSAAGALEVSYTAVQAKKGRPGTVVTVVARPDDRRTLVELIFRETTTIGVRYQEMARECLDRETIVVATSHGDVRFKVARRGQLVMNAQPEFDDLVRLSAERGAAVKEIQAAAWKAWLDRT